MNRFLASLSPDGQSTWHTWLKKVLVTLLDEGEYRGPPGWTTQLSQDLRTCDATITSVVECFTSSLSPPPPRFTPEERASIRQSAQREEYTRLVLRSLLSRPDFPSDPIWLAAQVRAIVDAVLEANKTT